MTQAQRAGLRPNKTSGVDKTIGQGASIISVSLYKQESCSSIVPFPKMKVFSNDFSQSTQTSKLERAMTTGSSCFFRVANSTTVCLISTYLILPRTSRFICLSSLLPLFTSLTSSNKLFIALSPYSPLSVAVKPKILYFLRILTEVTIFVPSI